MVGMARLALCVAMFGVVIVFWALRHDSPLVLQRPDVRRTPPPYRASNERTSGEIGVDDLDELLRGLRAWIISGCGRIDDMFADMVLDHLRDQSVEGAPARGDLLQHRCALGLHLHRALNSFQLATDASDPGQQLLLFRLDV
jgi:hypothetical protein